MEVKDELFSYRKLVAYQHARKFVSEIYQLLNSFPKQETYALCDQLRRAAISIPSNIAEAMGRTSLKEQIHFIEIAFGSLYEVMCQIELTKDLNYINDTQFTRTEESVNNIAKLLSGLRTKRMNMLNNGERMKG